jgi:hypothetical protein
MRNHLIRRRGPGPRSTSTTGRLDLVDPVVVPSTRSDPERDRHLASLMRPDRVVVVHTYSLRPRRRGRLPALSRSTCQRHASLRPVPAHGAGSIQFRSRSRRHRRRASARAGRAAATSASRGKSSADERTTRSCDEVAPGHPLPVPTSKSRPPRVSDLTRSGREGRQSSKSPRTTQR